MQGRYSILGCECILVIFRGLFRGVIAEVYFEKLAKTKVTRKAHCLAILDPAIQDFWLCFQDRFYVNESYQW
ncbi:conserved hypothetical protein [Ricinus communis]|uniref:Uncharacterized protein n=1 Tax=Ricinus communis TaxID=3988 RepID=B9SFP7_RICCO|nr:conserved hypothetical protein [Ricinus communis]